MHTTPGLITAWVHGWSVSRGAAEPQPHDWGFTIDVGLLDQVTRHVIASPTEDVVRKLAESSAARGMWLKVFVDEETVRPWLTPGWEFAPPGYLMHTALTEPAKPTKPTQPTSQTQPTTPTTIPDGFRLRTWTRGGVTQALLTAPDGSLAARGQVAPTGPTAVFDRIETSPAHRRRGFGSLVMDTLGAAARNAGAQTGVLGATVAGRGLYESLGWHVQAPLTSIRFAGAAEPA
ncbi:GNAT family N-acetyltransferase [Streptomyces sp. NPDC051940]|uniref:GNAT family N-acetyltransferase n=1 Tax=Streptomyces sp. NPDC051940 TaxID=3155675 RepID=UPI0034157881